MLIVDDLLATGGTAAATVGLVRGLGAEVVGLQFLIELVGLNGRGRLKGENVHAVLQYQTLGKSEANSQNFRRQQGRRESAFLSSGFNFE